MKGRYHSMAVIFYMQPLNFDEINKGENKFTEFKTWLTGMKPSEVMEKKNEIRDRMWDLLEYAWMLGYDLARDELGAGFEDFYPPDFDKERDSEILKDIAGKNFEERTNEYAETGDIPSLIRVAETDSHRIYNAGGNFGAKGLAETKTWNTALDNRVRDSHDYLEGVTVPIDEPFYTFNGDSAMYPGAFGIAEEDCNCRCYLTYQ